MGKFDRLRMTPESAARADRQSTWCSITLISAIGVWCLAAGVADGRWTWVLIGLGFASAAVTVYLNRLHPIPTTQTHTLREVHRTQARHLLAFVLSLAAIFGGIALAQAGIG